jgi:hypothetical protein
VFGCAQHGFSGWVGRKTALDGRIAKARRDAAPMPGWTLHDFRRLLSTTLHERLETPPHIVEAILGHIGHQAGTPGRYNLATYRTEKGIALKVWGERVLAVVEGRASKVVPLRA